LEPNKTPQQFFPDLVLSKERSTKNKERKKRKQNGKVAKKNTKKYEVQRLFESPNLTHKPKKKPIIERAQNN